MNNKHYTPISLGDTAGLSNDEWLKWREHGPYYKDPLDDRYISVTIGGSAVSVVFGDNPWMSKLELFHAKSGVTTPKYKRVMNQEILDAGHMLEDFVAHMFVRKMQEEGVTDVEMWNDTNMYQHPYYPFAVCNLDRRIRVNKVEGVLECKTTGNYEDIKLWEKGIVPKKYEWQCRYYMATMDLDYCYICCCWGFTLKETAVILITRDKEIEDMMMEEVSKFVDCCLMGKEPEEQTKHMETLANYYTRLYGEIEPSAPAVELPDSTEIYDLVTAAQSLSERKERAQKRLDEIEEEEYTIASKIMKLTGGKSTYATYRLDNEKVVAIKVKLPMKRATFDEERLKQDNPVLYDQYQEKKFNVTEFKEKEKKLAKDYILPAKIDTTRPCVLGDVVEKIIPATSVV